VGFRWKAGNLGWLAKESKRGGRTKAQNMHSPFDGDRVDENACLQACTKHLLAPQSVPMEPAIYLGLCLLCCFLHYGYPLLFVCFALTRMDSFHLDCALHHLAKLDQCINTSSPYCSTGTASVLVTWIRCRRVCRSRDFFDMLLAYLHLKWSVAIHILRDLWWFSSQS
jgi:hypothetical protein